MVDIFDDRDFRADNNNFDDFAAGELLDKYLEDTSVSFMEARAILISFPDANDWKKTSLRDLYEQAIEKQKPAKDSNAEKRTRRAVTLKELEDAENATKEYLARCNFLTGENKSLQQQITDLETENRRLVRENAHLEGRVSELERMVNQKFQKA